MSGHSFDMRCDITDNMMGITKSSTCDVEYNCLPKRSSDPVGEPQPTKYALDEGYPNPFNPLTNIKYALPKAGYVSLIVYDVLGRQAASLASGFHEAGYYSVAWDASLVSRGTYYARLKVADELSQVKFIKVIKLILMK